MINLTPEKYLRNPISFTTNNNPIRFVDNTVLYNPIFIYPQEEFKIINVYNIKDNMYYISSYGRIFSVHTGREIKPCYSNGYMRLSLMTNDNTKKFFFIHRLVAAMFIPKTIEDVELNRNIVNHKDLDGSDNHIWNLEWCTDQENIQHAKDNDAEGIRAIKLKLNMIKKPNKENPNWGTGIAKGEDNGQSRLTDEQVHTICKCLEKGMNYRQCCEEAGLEYNEKNQSIISNIAGGRRWQHISSLYNLQGTKQLNDLTSYIIPVCELLEKKEMNIKQIVEYLQIPGSYDSARMFVSGIKNRKIYKYITKNYKF